MISLNSYFVRNCFPKSPEFPLPISNYELSITNYGFLVIDFLFPISNSTAKIPISVFTDIFTFFTEFSALPA
jgi:hypothetical protein